MTKYFVEVLEPTEDPITKERGMEIKTKIEKASLIEARTAKIATTPLLGEIVRVHICKHGDGPNGTNLPCEVE